MHVCAKTTAPPPKVINSSVYLVNSASHLCMLSISVTGIWIHNLLSVFPLRLLQTIQWKFFFYLENRFSIE